MGSVASPRGNAVTESLMGVVKNECVHARHSRRGRDRDIRVHRALHNKARSIHSAPG